MLILGIGLDHTSDGLFGLAITMPAGIAAVGAGMVMAVVLPGKYRLGGLAFMALIPLLLFQAFDLGWRVSYHDITEGRAAQIAQALDQFHSREGHYPPTLTELTRDLMFIGPARHPPWSNMVLSERLRFLSTGSLLSGCSSPVSFTSIDVLVNPLAINGIVLGVRPQS